MAFATPLWLLAAAFAIVAIALHMRRRRTIEVASVQIWRRFEGVFTPRRALHPPKLSWLLFLQIAAILLVALALARPLFGTDAAVQHRIFVLDASGSMRSTDAAPSRFAAAQAEIERQLRSLGDGDAPRLSIAVAGPRASLVAARLDRPAGLARRIERLETTDGAADWQGAARLLAGLVRADETTEVVILGDETAAARQILGAALPGVAILGHAFGAPATANASIIATLTPPAEGKKDWKLAGHVGLDTGASTTVRVVFMPAGSTESLEWATIDITAPAGAEAAEVPFERDLALPGPGTVALLLPADAGPADNGVYLLAAGPASRSVLYLGEPDNDLVRALRAVPGVEVYAAETLPDDDARFDLVVVDGVAVARRPAGNVLWIGAGRVAPETEPTALAAPAPTGWRNDHPLARGVAWNALAVGAAVDLPAAPGGVTLLEAAGRPLVDARTIAAGRDVRVAFRLRDSSWPEQTAFPVFIANLIDWAAPMPATCTAGIVCAVDPRLGTATWERILPAGGTAVIPAALALPEAGGAVIAGDGPAVVPMRAGIYRSAGGTALLAVNPAPGEGVAVSAVEPAPSLFSSRSVWWWLLAAAVLCLAVEAWLAGRGTERFLRASGLAATNPLAGRRRLLLGLRIAVLALLAAALAGLALPWRSPAQGVVVVADAAQPAKAAGDAAVASWTAAGATVSAVTVGEGDAAIPPGDAVDVAAAMLPADHPGRVVVASASAAPENPATLAAALADRGTAVDSAFAPSVPADAAVVGLDLPSRLRAGDSFTLRALLTSGTAQPAQVDFLRDGAPIGHVEVTLPAGRSSVTMEVADIAAGDALYEARVTAAADPQPANNQSGMAVTVEGPPRVAVVSNGPTVGSLFAEALQTQGIDAQQFPGASAPTYRRDWNGFDVIALLDVPAIDLGTHRQGVIKGMVSDGRGLLLLGGPNAFGPGGYFQTPLEEMSPLSARVPRQAPKAAMVFVIDRSGSMQAMVGPVTRLDIAKQATLSASALLNPQSQVGIIAFDSEAHVILPLQPRRDDNAMRASLDQLVPGGGTALYPALVAALDQLEGVDAPVRHIVVMSDGLSQPADFPEIVKRIAAAGITVSTVAIGERTDVDRLQEIARLGGGAFHATQDFNALPSILSQEAMMLSGNPVEEREAQPVWVDRAVPFLVGLPDAMPPVEGYVLTTARPEARLHMSVDDAEGVPMPLMASWHFGNGQVLAFASEGAGPWVLPWMNSAVYAKLWAQAVRHFVPAAAPENGLAITTARHGRLVDIVAEATGDEGVPLTGLAVSAMLDPPPAGVASPLPLNETAPGHYAATLPLDTPGTYRIDVAAGDLEGSTRLAIGYPSALEPDRDTSLMRALTAATGGRSLSAASAVPAVGTAWSFLPGWRIFAALALVLFMLDLAVRYVPDMLRRLVPRRAGTVAAPGMGGQPQA